MSGVYKSLAGFLKEAPSLQGVDVRFGEETNSDLNVRLPRITIYPFAGVLAAGAGMTPRGAVNPAVNMVWELNEMIQVHCWAKSDKLQPTALDHYEECEILRRNVLQAFRYQMYHFESTVGPGIYFNITPSNTFWRTDEAKIKMGRALVIELSMRIAITDVEPVEAVIKHFDVSQKIIK